MTSVPIKVRTGSVFSVDDDLGIAEPVLDHGDPIIAFWGFGCGEVQPRFMPGVDVKGNMHMKYGTLIKGSVPQYGDNGFGFEGDRFVVRMRGKNILTVTDVGATLFGVLAQEGVNNDFLPDSEALGQLLFPLFSSKTLLAQFDRPAFAGIHKDGVFRASRNIAAALTAFNSIVTRTGGVGNITDVSSYYDETGTLRFATPNLPRITFDPVTKKCRGLLIEPKTTNLLTQSFFPPGWGKVNAITFLEETLTTWSNKGLRKPFTFTEGNSAGEHSFSQNSTADVTLPLSESFFFSAKAFSGIRRFTIFVGTEDRSHLFGANFESVAGGPPVFKENRIVGNGTVSGVSIDDIGNGIFRLTVSGIINNVGTAGPSTVSSTFASLGSAAGNANLVFTPEANTGNWCNVNQYQLEQNAQSTSYLPAADATLVRQADVLTLDLQNFRFDNREGLIEFKFRGKNRRVQAVSTVLFSLETTTGENRIEYFVSANDSVSGSHTIGSKTYNNNVLVSTNPAVGSVPNLRGSFVLDYTNLSFKPTVLKVDGSKGFFGTISLISYE